MTTTTMNMKKPARTWTGNPNSRNAGCELIARAYAAWKVPPTDSDRVDSSLVPYVYAFDHKHRRPPMEYEGPPRRQGRQPRRDDHAC